MTVGRLVPFSFLRSFAAICILYASSATVKADIFYQVKVNTGALSGTTGNIDFQFNPGNASTQAAMVNISSFLGATVNGLPLTTGAVSGTLPSTVTINNSGAFNDYFQDVTFGPSFSFILQFRGPAVTSPNGTATSGSSFGLSLYNTAGDTPLLTNNADGFLATANLNLNGTVSTATYRSNTSGGAPAAVLTAIPEPATFALFGVSFLFLAAFIARRRAATPSGIALRLRP